MSINEWVEKYGARPSRLLIVDDAEGIAMVIQSALRGYNVEYDVVPDGETASLRLRDHRYDLIFLDITLPGKSGIDVLKEIKDLCPETPVVMMTGHFDGSLIAKATELGIVSLMRKPQDFTPAFIKEIFRLFKLRGEPCSLALTTA